MSELKKTLNTQILLRTGTTAQWTDTSKADLGANLVLGRGETGVEITTATDKSGKAIKRFKIGDGSTTWANLPYIDKTEAEIEALATQILNDNKSSIITSANEYTDQKISEIPKGGSVYQLTYPDEEYSDAVSKEDLLEKFSVGKTFVNGDMAIIVEEIVDPDGPETTGEDGKVTGTDPAFVSRTAYYYNKAANEQSGAWVAFDGNYSADNVYFDDDLTITASVGIHEVSATEGSKVISIKGKSLKGALNTLFAKEILPTKKTPSFDFKSVSGMGKKEVGDSISVTYSMSFDAKTYEYGPGTGATADSWTVTLSGTSAPTTNNPKTTQSGTFDSIKVTDTTSVTLKAQCTHTASTNHLNALTNLKSKVSKEYGESLAFNAGSLANKDYGTKLTGYRPWFCYVGNDLSEIDSEFIRTKCTNQGEWKASELTLKIPNRTKRILIAIPKGSTAVPANSTNKYSYAVKDCIDLNNNANVNTNFLGSNLKVVSVNDKSGSNPMDYIVCVADNENGIDATSYKFTFASYTVS